MMHPRARKGLLLSLTGLLFLVLAVSLFRYVVMNPAALCLVVIVGVVIGWRMYSAHLYRVAARQAPSVLPSLEIRSLCPHCDTPLAYDRSRIGDVVACPACQQSMTLAGPPVTKSGLMVPASTHFKVTP